MFWTARIWGPFSVRNSRLSKVHLLETVCSGSDVVNFEKPNAFLPHLSQIQVSVLLVRFSGLLPGKASHTLVHLSVVPWKRPALSAQWRPECILELTLKMGTLEQLLSALTSGGCGEVIMPMPYSEHRPREKGTNPHWIRILSLCPSSS